MAKPNVSFLARSLLTVSVSFASVSIQAQTLEDDVETDESVLTPEQEENYRPPSQTPEWLPKLGVFVQRQVQVMTSFPQTKWRECDADVTGNYSGYGCSNHREISVILDGFVQSQLQLCVTQALGATGVGAADSTHLVHVGIKGDANHSPHSLHAASRAIDLKTFVVSRRDGQRREIVYANEANRPFFRAFRSCWGQVLAARNKCPLYNGEPGLTGSIGWEDARHRQHLHVSVPHCTDGQYGSYYWQR